MFLLNENLNIMLDHEIGNKYKFSRILHQVQTGGCVQQEVQPGGDPVSKVKGERDCKGWSDISSPSLVFAVLDSTVPLAVLAKIHLSLGLYDLDLDLG